MQRVEHHGREALRLRETIHLRQHRRALRLPEQKRQVQELEQRGLLGGVVSGVGDLLGGVLSVVGDVVNGALGGGQPTPPASSPAAQPTPTTTQAPAQPPNPTTQSQAAPGATTPAPASPTTTTPAPDPPASEGENLPPTTTVPVDQSTPAPSSTESTGTIPAQVEAESNINFHHGSMVNSWTDGVGEPDNTSRGTGRGIRTITTTDSNGSTIVFETGKPTSDTPGAEIIPVTARVGIGLVVTCAVIGMVLACFYFQRKRRRARTHGRSQKWWDTRRPGSIVYRDEKDTEPAVQGVQITQVTTNSVSVPRPAGPSSPLYSQPNVAFALPVPPPAAEVRNPMNSLDYATTSSSAYSASSASHHDERFSIGTLDTLDSSFYAPVTHRHSLAPASGQQQDRRPSSTSMPNNSFPPLRQPEGAAVDRTSAGNQPRAVSFSDRASMRSGSSGYTPSADESIQSTINITPDLRPRSAMSSSSVSTMDPFADPAYLGRGAASPAADTRVQSATAHLRHVHGLSTSSSAETDPFSESIIASSCYGFEEYERVRFPVIGNLSDELSLRRGDEVRILRVFEDGWAMVERASVSQTAERGFVPVDCLRDSSPLAAGAPYPRRVDSYTTSLATMRS